VADAGLLALDSLNAILPAAVYLALVRRVRRQGGAWPAARTAAFVGAVVVLAVATSSVADEASRRSLAWHMTGQMAILLLVPPAIVAGRPLRLVGQALGRRVSLTPSPAVAWLAFVGIQWAVHIPAVFGFALREPVAYGLMHWLLPRLLRRGRGRAAAPAGARALRRRRHADDRRDRPVADARPARRLSPLRRPRGARRPAGRRRHHVRGRERAPRGGGLDRRPLPVRGG
jgi:hypothetical protein